MTPKHSVTANRAAAIERRAELAESFRRDLLAELGAETLTTSQRELVDCAVSCHVEIAEVSSRFYRGRAREPEMAALSAARSQQIRALRALGLPKPKPDRPGPTTIEEILAEEAEIAAKESSNAKATP